jgi:hypothetical protein
MYIGILMRPGLPFHRSEFNIFVAPVLLDDPLGVGNEFHGFQGASIRGIFRASLVFSSCQYYRVVDAPIS